MYTCIQTLHSYALRSQQLYLAGNYAESTDSLTGVSGVLTCSSTSSCITWCLCISCACYIRICEISVLKWVVSEFVGDRSTRVFSSHDIVDYSRVIVDHHLQQLIVGVRYRLYHVTLLSRDLHCDILYYTG